MTLSDVQGHSLPQAFQMWFFVQLCSNWQDFDWHSASRGPSAVAELLVTKPCPIIRNTSGCVQNVISYSANLPLLLQNV